MYLVLCRVTERRMNRCPALRIALSPTAYNVISNPFFRLRFTTQ